MIHGSGEKILFPPASYQRQMVERFFLDTARLAGYESICCPDEWSSLKTLESPIAENPGKYSVLNTAGSMGLLAGGIANPAAAAELAAVVGDFLGILGFQDVSLTWIGPQELTKQACEMFHALQLDCEIQEGNEFSFRLAAGELEIGRGGCLEPVGYWVELSVQALLKAAKAQGVSLPQPDQLMLYLVPADDAGQKVALAVAEELRSEGFSAEIDWTGISPEQGLSKAEEKGARYFAAVNQENWEQQDIVIRCLADAGCFHLELGDSLTRFFYDSELSELSDALDGDSFSFGMQESIKEW